MCVSSSSIKSSTPAPLPLLLLGASLLLTISPQIKLSVADLPPRQHKSVITDRLLAQRVYSGKTMYAWDMRRQLLSEKSSVTPAQAAQALAEAHTMWDQLKPCKPCTSAHAQEVLAEGNDSVAKYPECSHMEAELERTHAFWRAKAREHDEKWPIMVQKIRDAFKENPARSFPDAAASKHIEGWCSGEAIARLFRSCRYSHHMERALPLLTKKQRRDSVAFSRFLRSNWGRGKGKYLWIAWDEKWFYGMLLRHAKMCEALNIKRAHLYAKHKNHFEKVMVAALIGYAFEDHPENGGTGVLLGLHRIEGARIARKEQREAVFADDGTHTFSGPILRRNGDVVVVDCELTGSSTGTSDRPKFSLLNLFRECVVEQVAIIVGEGGPFEGHTPIFTHDNGGPHIEEGFVEYMEGVCDEKGWGWFPQSPQSPYLNPCDLYLFPMMSRRHSTLLRTHHGRSMPTKDQIWTHAKGVFWELASALIAMAFVQTYRVAGRVIEERGGNHFLNEGKVHVGVRKNFDVTPTGIKPKAGHGPFPPPAAAPSPYIPGTKRYTRKRGDDA